jgi:hypothetical protein
VHNYVWSGVRNCCVYGGLIGDVEFRPIESHDHVAECFAVLHDLTADLAGRAGYENPHLETGLGL